MMIETQTTIVSNSMSVRIAITETIYIGVSVISTRHLALDILLSSLSRSYEQEAIYWKPEIFCLTSVYILLPVGIDKEIH